MTAGPCVDKDLHTNIHEKVTWISFNNHFKTNAYATIHVENYVILMNKYIWIWINFVYSIWRLLMPTTVACKIDNALAPEPWLATRFVGIF